MRIFRLGTHRSLQIQMMGLLSIFCLGACFFFPRPFLPADVSSALSVSSSWSACFVQIYINNQRVFECVCLNSCDCHGLTGRLEPCALDLTNTEGCACNVT
jgi:hypothetical protein